MAFNKQTKLSKDKAISYPALSERKRKNSIACSSFSLEQSDKTNYKDEHETRPRSW